MQTSHKSLQGSIKSAQVNLVHLILSHFLSLTVLQKLHFPYIPTCQDSSCLKAIALFCFFAQMEQSAPIFSDG
jgi:hypothetical protein